MTELLDFDPFPPHLDMELPARQTPPGRRPRKRQYGTTYAGPGIDPIPDTPAIMDAAASAWVREHVLTPAYLPGATEGYLTRCACQWGLCGGCERGRCDHCLSLRSGGSRRVAETHITDRKGFVRPAAVYLAHTRCRYLCPCRCAKVAPAAPPPARRPEQLDLFEVA